MMDDGCWYNIDFPDDKIVVYEILTRNIAVACHLKPR